MSFGVHSRRGISWSQGGRSRPSRFPRTLAFNFPFLQVLDEMRVKFHLVTFGCQMNDFDSQRMSGLLTARGYIAESDPSKADVILLNTCSIREKAEHKVFSQLGRFLKFKARNPRLVLGIAGCMAQEHGRSLLRQVPELDLVVGTHNAYRVPELVEEVRSGRGKQVETGERDLVQPIEYESVARSSPVKAWVTIMEGCDYLCSFCIVPYVRGRERNRTPEEIVEEVRWLCGNGWREICLLGQTVNKYRYGDVTFAELLRRLDGVEGLERLRFASPHPNDFDEELAWTMAELGTVCEHVHAPVQSGSTRVLRKMRRKYGREDYLEKVAMIRRAMPEVALSTDIIVGFPSETEAEFRETLSLLEEVEFDHVFAFQYSEREGTGASRLADDLPEAEKRARLHRLFALQEKIGKRRNEALVGRVMEVLVEGPSVRDPRQLTGRTRQNKIVNFEGGSAVGDLVRVRLTRAAAHSFRGELVDLVSGGSNLAGRAPLNLGRGAGSDAGKGPPNDDPSLLQIT